MKVPGIDRTIAYPPGDAYTRGLKLLRFFPGQFWRRHPVLRFFAVFAFTILFLAAATGGSVLYYYCKEASEYDLSAISRFERGAQVLDSKGQRIGALDGHGRILLARREIPDTFLKALLAAEDTRFFEHQGFDSLGIVRAMVENYRNSEITQGASTLTQQLARNSTYLGGRTYHRKMLEICFAYRIEKKFSKDEILTHYANRIYFGSGFYGLGAAARGYFDKTPEQLTLAESALLCGLIRSPNSLSPFNDPEASEKAKQRVIDRMLEEGIISGQIARETSAAPIVLVNAHATRGRPLYLLAKVRKELDAILGSADYGNVIVETSLDSSLQTAAEQLISSELTELEQKEGYSHPTRADYRSGEVEKPNYLQGAAVVIENATGRVVSIVASRDQRESHYDRPSLSQRPPGMSFTPFVYAAAFESGRIHPLTPTFDAPIDNREVMLGGIQGILGEWGTERTSNEYLGRIPAGYALISGKSAATVRVGFQTGLERVHQVAKAAGIDSPMSEYPAAFLGASEVNLIELTRAYTVFPNLGVRPKAVGLIDRIVDHEGKVLYQRPEGDEIFVRAMSPASSVQVSVLLRHAVRERSNEAERRILESLPGEVAAMSGTSCDYQDNWVLGSNAKYTWGVWVGMDQPQTIYPRAFSRDTAMPIWARIAKELDTGERLAGSEGCPETAVCFESGNLAHLGCRSAGHRCEMMPLSQSLDFRAFCPKGREIAGLKPQEELSAIRAVPVGEGSARVNNAQPVIPLIPVLAGEDAYGVLGR